jgi:hypothetical protein
MAEMDPSILDKLRCRPEYNGVYDDLLWYVAVLIYFSCVILWNASAREDMHASWLVPHPKVTCFSKGRSETIVDPQGLPAWCGRAEWSYTFVKEEVE